MDLAEVSPTMLHGDDIILMEIGAEEDGVYKIRTKSLKHIKSDGLRTEEETPWGPKGGGIMEDFTLLKDGRISDVRGGVTAGFEDIHRSESLSRWRHFVKELGADFKAPFQSDWEQKSGLHWKEWGKL